MSATLSPVIRLYGAGPFCPGTAAPQVRRTYRQWAEALPDSVSATLALLRLPPPPEAPGPLRGKFVVNLRIAAVTGAAEGERLLAPGTRHRQLLTGPRRTPGRQPERAGKTHRFHLVQLTF